ncbi:hypothetical protein OPQ81_008874 [Rhizoctonia solani]|nr:hypothetical protein OPQ81_008874 [Rhizoctonia solani]
MLTLLIPNCRLDAIKSFCSRYILGRYPGSTCPVCVILWIVSITVVVVVATLASFLLLLLRGQAYLEITKAASKPLGGNNHTRVSERRRNCPVEELLLDATQSPKHSAFNNPSAGPSLATHELHSDGRSETILSSNICFEGSTAIERGCQRGSSNRHLWRLSTASLWRGFSEYRRIARIANTHLLRSLLGFHPTLFVLVIVVEEGVHDLEILQLLMSGSSKPGQIHLTGLGGEVSLDKIYAAIKQLYDESVKVPGSQLLILLSGHGDSASRMCLPGNEFITETDLYRLFEELKLENTCPSPIPITILFDFCRESESSSAEPPEGVSLIWSCSPGENAHAFRLPHDPKIPHSCFLLALMMGPLILTVACTGEILKNRLKDHLDQLAVYLQEVHLLRHSNGKCPICPGSDKFCKKPQQNIDWSKAKANISNDLAIYINPYT